MVLALRIRGIDRSGDPFGELGIVELYEAPYQAAKEQNQNQMHETYRCTTTTFGGDVHVTTCFIGFESLSKS